MHPTDPLYAQQWHFGLLGNIEKIWDEYSGAGIHVGVYDTGIQSTHPDLNDNYDASRELLFNNVVVSGAPLDLTNSSNAHGTEVAGLIAAENNGSGAVGVAWGATVTGATISAGSPFDFTAADDTGFIAALDQMTKFDVVNNSWGQIADFAPDQNVNVAAAQEADTLASFAAGIANGRGGLGTIIVQASGNDNGNSEGDSVDNSRFTITVAATQPDGVTAVYSNYGPCVLVSAPGGSFEVRLTTTDFLGVDGNNMSANPSAASDYTDLFAGTSAATPIVTGIVALMLDANQNLGWRDVQNILSLSATHTGSPLGNLIPGTNEIGHWVVNDAVSWNGGGLHYSTDYGYGMVNAYNAVRMAEVWSLFTPAAQTYSNEIEASSGLVTFEQAIADNATTLFTLNVGANVSIEHVDLTLDFTHADIFDLRISLISPQGTETEVYGRFGGVSGHEADSGLVWTFGLDDLRGELSAGTWTVKIKDELPLDTGTLHTAKVQAFGTSVSGNDVYHYTDEFLATAALSGQGGRATLADTNGGVDWIDAAAVTGNFVLNLTAGAQSTVNGANWFTIAAGTLIENAVTGDGNDRLIGNAGNNALYGMRGNDILDGGAGADLMKGGPGDDTYVVDNPADTVDETGGGGVDVIQSSIGFSLATVARVIGAVENLTLLGSAAINGTGNGGNNTIFGNIGANVLNAGAGNDVLTGGRGHDSLIGGAGLDRFDFNAANESVVGPNRDTISGFSHSQHDRIDLSTIDASTVQAGNQAFTFIGADTFAHYHSLHHAVFGMVRFAGGIVQGNVNAAMAADFEIKVIGAAALASSDFLL